MIFRCEATRPEVLRPSSRLRTGLQISRLRGTIFVGSLVAELPHPMERPTSASQPKHTNIGVVGLGIIGRGIAGYLRGKGFSVFVWNRSPRPVPNFVGSPGELADLCNYIQIFVSDGDALVQTVQQLGENLTPRHVVFAHSTVAPDSVRAAADVVERRGARFVEACFTGSKGAAEKGELVYYVGGTDEAVREGRPILAASSKEILHIGPIGQASAIKVATNMITAASIQATAEALALVQAEGLPFEKFADAMRINASYSGTLAMKLPKMIDRDFTPHFSVKHMLKDMQIASQIALSRYLDLGVTAAARDQLFEQMQWGHGDDDYSAVLRKYLHEPSSPAHSEESHSQQAVGESDAEESNNASAEADTQNVEAQEGEAVAVAEPVVSFSGTMNATAPAATPLRRGFIKQLLSRFSSGEG
jgi:3-hydroxyisobutyrate dehydrogenase-like beta-hydroxyacid dehydrogenase